MSLDLEVQKSALEFSQLLLQNDSNDMPRLIMIYHHHFLNSRIHLKDWYIPFNSTVIKILTDNKVNSGLMKVVKEALNFEFKIQESNFFKIRDIIIKKRKNVSLSFNTDYFINSYKFLHDYKNYFMTKHLYSILNNFDKIVDINIDDFNFKDLFLNINSKSLTGQLFIMGENESNIIFKIPFNISTNFMFWHKNKLIGIDTSISKDFDSEIVLNHFINLHILYNKNPKEIQELLKKIQPKKNKSIISKLSNEKVIDYNIVKSLINDRVEYIIDLDLNTEYESLNFYEILTAYLILIESDTNNGYQVPDQLNKIVFYEIINQLGYQDVINKDFRENCLVRILSSFKDYNAMIYNLTILPENRNFIKDILIKFYKKVELEISSKKNNEIVTKNILFSSGINSKENRDIIFENLSNKSIVNMKDFFFIFKSDSKWISDIISTLSSNHVDNLIVKSINHGLKDKSIIETIIKFDAKINLKILQRKIDNYREHREFKKVLDMNLNVKK